MTSRKVKVKDFKVKTSLLLVEFWNILGELLNFFDNIYDPLKKAKEELKHFLGL